MDPKDSTFEIKLDEGNKSITIENMSNITIVMEKPKDENQKDFKWFLINEEEIKNSKIGPVGLKNSTVECTNEKFSFEFNIQDEAKTCVAKFVLTKEKDESNENAIQKEITLDIKNKSNEKKYTKIFFDNSDELEEVDDLIFEIDSNSIIVEKNKPQLIKIKGKSSKTKSWYIENFNEIKNKYYFSGIEDLENGKLTFKESEKKKAGEEGEEKNNDDDEEKDGHYEFTLCVTKIPEGDLTPLKFVFKRNDGNENEKEKKQQKKLEIKLIKKKQKDKIKKKICYECNRWSILRFLCDLIALTCSAVASILSFQIESDANVTDKISKELLDNFQASYITEISKQTPSINEDPSKESNANYIVFDKWQGTNYGCGKINKNNSTDVYPIKEGEKCKDGYEYLEKIPPMNIYVYKGFIINKISPSNSRYIDLLYDGSIIPKDGECPKGKRNCGYIDTIFNLLCLDINLDCPINYIKIDKNPPPSYVKNVKVLEGDQINIYYSNNPYENSTQIPYIQAAFKIGEDELCTIPSLYYTDLNLFPLDANKKDYANQCTLKDYTQNIVKYTDEIYHSLDIVDNYELYKENKIIDKISNSQLVKYGYKADIYKDNQLHLYVRRFFGFNKECLDKRNKKYNIITQLNKINGVANKMETWAFSTHFEIGSTFFSALDFFSISDFISRGENWSLVESLIKNLFGLLISCVLGIISLHSNAYDDPCEDIMECSDDFTNNNYNIMIKKLRKSGKMILACSIIITITLFFCLFSLILRVVEKFKKVPKKEKMYIYTIQQYRKQYLEMQEQLLKKEAKD